MLLMPIWRMKIEGDRLGLWKRIADAWNVLTAPEISMDDERFLELMGITTRDRRKIGEVTYFTCLKVLSETMGKLPLKYYQDTENGRIRADPDDVYELLSLRPNRIMSASTFWTTMEYNTEHHGNGYAWMRGEFTPENYGGEYRIIDIWPMPSQQVSVMMDDVGVFGDKGRIYYQYSDQKTGEQYMFRQEEVLHFKTWFSADGFMGQPVRKILETTLDGALESQNYMNNLYENGLTASMAMQYLGDLDEEKRRKLQNKFGKELTGAKNAGKVVPVPIGLQLTPLNMNLTDAQFFELRKFGALQIAGAFGIKPNQINNFEKSSYANSEAQQLAFLIDTMSYRLTHYEQEINYKILSKKKRKDGFLFKFNEKAILRTTSDKQMEFLVKAVQNFIYSPNEARELLDKPQKEGGDQLIGNGNYIPIDMVGNQYMKGGGENGNSGN